MTRFKQNKFYKSSKINGNYVAVPLSSDKTTSQIDQGLDQLTKGKEALRWERIGLLEDSFVQAVAKFSDHIARPTTYRYRDQIYIENYYD